MIPIYSKVLTIKMKKTRRDKKVELVLMNGELVAGKEVVYTDTGKLSTFAVMIRRFFPLDMEPPESYTIQIKEVEALNEIQMVCR